MSDFSSQREQMVEHQIRRRGVSDLRVLAAMRKVRREAFVPGPMREEAYTDGPLPIGEGQTISQPYIVAYMIEALDLKDGAKALEIGAGSGYAAAVLAEIAGEVYAVERVRALAQRAMATLTREGYTSVRLLHGDGTCGWNTHAPFDGILVSAGAPDVPESLKSQLAIGGTMVIPIGRDPSVQELVRLTRRGKDHFDRESLAGVRFVPLVGAEGWSRRVP